MLAWLIKGAVRWYRNGQMMPEPPASVVAGHRGVAALSGSAAAYRDDRLVFDTDAHAMSKELYDDFTDWLKEHGHQPGPTRTSAPGSASTPRWWLTGSSRSGFSHRRSSKRCHGLRSRGGRFSGNQPLGSTRRGLGSVSAQRPTIRRKRRDQRKHYLWTGLDMGS